MWHFISDQISESIGKVFICETIRRVQQQHHHESYVVKDSQQRFFVKVCSEPERYADGSTPLLAEGQGLLAFQQINQFQTPKLICHATCSNNGQNFEYLVMQYLAFKSPSEALWAEAGQLLARHHRQSCEKSEHITQGKFGWTNDNFIGTTLQRNPLSEDWPQFFIHNRIEDLVRQLPDIQPMFKGNVIQKLHDRLAKHDPPPCLLHGDLWHGNIGFCATKPVLFDPAVWVGDRECDLAMSHLFGGFAQTFYRHYESEWALDEGAEMRQAIYQLHPVLNHILLFGNEYLPTLNDLLARIMKD